MIDLENLGLSKEGIAYVRSVLDSPPSRAVASYRGSKIGRFASPARGYTLQFESRHLEFAYLHELEFDNDVRTVADQPAPIIPKRPPGTSRPVGSPRRADFLVIRHTKAELIECKPETKLIELQEKRPEWYFLDGESRWHFLPMEIASRSLGLTYRIVTESQLSATLCQNVSFLWPYYIANLSATPKELIRQVRSHLDRNSFEGFNNLCPIAGDRPDIIYSLLAEGTIYVDLKSAIVFDTEGLTIYRDEATYRQIKELSQTCSVTEPTRPNLPAMMAGLTPHELQETLKRYRAIEPYLISDSSPPKKNHFAYRYFRRFKKSEKEGRPGIEGIQAKTSDRGRRGERLPEHTKKVMEELYEQHWEDPVSLTKERFYGLVIKGLGEVGYTRPTRKTIYRYMYKFENKNTERRRSGWVSAYHKREFSAHEQMLEPHGNSIFEVVHIDHKLVRALLQCSTSGILLGLCWLTLAVDAFSRTPLAFWLDFARPSVVSVMMVLRDMVRRFGRLPTCLVTDNGAEFHSTLLQLFLAKHGVHELYRAPRRASDGGVLERVFRTIDNDLINGLEGVISKGIDIKKYDPFIDPRARATETIGSLYEKLETYLFSVYPELYHSSLGASPREIWDDSNELSGLLNLPKIPYDYRLYFDTLPFDVSRPTRQVGRNGEISFRSIPYHHTRLMAPTLKGQFLDVRFDPAYDGFVFTRIGKVWIKCNAGRPGAHRKSHSRLNDLERRRRTALREQFRPERALEIARMHQLFEMPLADTSLMEGESKSPASRQAKFHDIDFDRIKEGKEWNLPKS